MPGGVAVNELADPGYSGHGLGGIVLRQFSADPRCEIFRGLGSPADQVIGWLCRLQVREKNISASLGDTPVPGIGRNAHPLAPTIGVQSMAQAISQRREAGGANFLG